MRIELFFAGALALVACSSAPDSRNAGVYPAFATELPRVVDQGGAVLSAPKIVTVTWNADPDQATIDAFADGLGPSGFWAAATSEYGIGPATNTNVHVATPPPSSISDADVAALVATQGNGAWPANDAQTVYVVYLPEATTLTSSGANDCPNEDGYHDETSSAADAHVVYAVVNESCHDTQDLVSFTTEVASHEIVEAATDPHAQSDLAWTGFDADHYAWEVWSGSQDELSDACEYFPEANYEDAPPYDFWLQRSWSNASAAAGHDPCVPVPPGAFYDATPLALDSIALTVNGAAIATKGYSIAVGATRTIQIGLASDAPHAPWTVDVVEGDGFTAPAFPRLAITQHGTSGQNGELLDVDVKTLSTNAAGVLVTILSSAPGEPTRYMPFLVATE